MTRRLLSFALIGASALLLAAPAAAQDTRSYFTAFAASQAIPPMLGEEERRYYEALFTAIEQERWSEVETRLAERADGLLHPVARAQFYLAATSPRVELPQIEAWLASGSDLPQAAQMGRLGLRRGAAAEPALAPPAALAPRAAPPRRNRPATISDGTMPDDIRSAILERISGDDPDGARLLLDGVDAVLSPEARAEWRQRVAWSYYIENRDAEALAMARTVAEGSGPWVAEGHWAEALAAWRLNDCASALAAFEQAAAGTADRSLRAAAYYWASRSALRCRQPDRASRLLAEAARDDEVLYGMLALEALGRQLPRRVEDAAFTGEDWQRLSRHRNIRVAAALAQIGRDELASEVLLHQSRIGDPADYEAISRLARALGFTQTQLFMAHNAPAGGAAHPAAHYPAARWQPLDGWRVDPALAHAITLQESVFRPRAVSPANAQGLMQITPATLRQHAPCIGRPADAIDPFDPATNLALGQCNLAMLRADPATGGTIPRMLAAYNAGLTPVRRWQGEINDQGDPLLWMESIPYWETRGYVGIVMRNYWMYERQAGASSASRIELAQNRWPLYLDAAGGGDGRVWLSAGAR